MSFSSGRTDIPSHLKQNKETGNGIHSLCCRTRWEPQSQIPIRSVHQTFRANSHESSSRCAFHISVLPTRSHTCFRFLEEIIKPHFFCIIRVVLKMRICAYTTRRLQWTVIDCERNLQQRPRTLYKKKCRCTSYKSHPHIKIGCTPVRRTWELLKMSCLSLSMQVIEFYLCDGFLRACPFSFAWHSFDRFRFLFFLTKNQAYRQSFSACRWASCHTTSALGVNFWLRVSLGCQMHLDQVTLKTCPQSLSASLRVMSSKKKKNQNTGLSVLVMNSQLFFADSLTSTLLDWMGYATGLSVLARLHYSINAGIGVEPALSCGNDVGGDVPDELDEQEVVDHTRTTIATGFTCNRRRKSACRTNPWQVFPNICRSNFGEDIADLSNDCVDVQWLLALVGGGNPSDSPRRSSWTSPRTWMVPCQGWSSQNMISSNKFNCPSAVFENCPQFGQDHLLRVELYVVEFWRVYFCPPAQGLLPQEFLSKLLSPRTRRIQGVLPVILCSRIGGISIGQKQKWSDNHSNEPNKILWHNWFVEAPFLRYFSQIVAIHHGTHPPSSGQLQQLRKSSSLCSACHYSAISNLFDRWGVDSDFSKIPWSTSQINAKFQEMIPCRPWEVLFHHGSLCRQILPHDSVSVMVSRFTVSI